jgi:hypothetical protein
MATYFDFAHSLALLELRFAPAIISLQIIKLAARQKAQADEAGG